eukprot:TRINITY_DN1706_c1_g1_i3.p1 TRINITY_DN1706_c1_g1~~TRINITY_DN1706_c1_g1_i3.p1  ORF type:complete len:552 (+),score=113.60 TRINITY_DN1706_c1_g1_i3:50-1705(+)
MFEEKFVIVLWCGILLYSCNAVYLNFEWNDYKVYGQDNFTSSTSNYFSRPQDFIIVKNSQDILSSSNISFFVTDSGIPTFPLLKVDLLSGPPPTFSALLVRLNYTMQSFIEVDTSYIFSAGHDIYSLPKNLNVQNMVGLLSSSSNVTGITFYNGRFYFSNPGYCAVYSFNATNLVEPPVVYNSLNRSSTCSTNFTSVRKTVVDSSRNLIWVADDQANQVIAFPLANSSGSPSSLPSIILGQVISSSSSSALANKVLHPKAMAFSDDFSVLFVADSNRIVRFRAPFSSGQAAEGMLGYDSFSDNFLVAPPTSEATLNNPVAIHYEDYKNGSGRLSILDAGNRRIITGITSTLLPSTLPIYCDDNNNNNNNNTNEKCKIEGTVTVANNQIFVFNSTQLQVNGNITFNNQSTITVSAGQIINSTGIIYFSGDLKFSLNNNNTNVEENNNNITIFLHNGSQGEFESISIIQEESSNGRCKKEGRGEYRERSMGIIITTECGDGREGGVNKKVIIGVVVGVVALAVCIVIVVGVVVIVGMMLQRQKARRSKGSVNF